MSSLASQVYAFHQPYFFILVVVTTRSNELPAWLGIEDLDLILKERRLRWYGHVERSNGAVKTAFHIQVGGKRGPGRSKMTWKQLTERDCRRWKLSAVNPHDRNMWRSGVQQASYLEGGPLMWMLPLYLHVNQKSDYDMILLGFSCWLLWSIPPLALCPGVLYLFFSNKIIWYDNNL